MPDHAFAAVREAHRAPRTQANDLGGNARQFPTATKLLLNLLDLKDHPRLLHMNERAQAASAEHASFAPVTQPTLHRSMSQSAQMQRPLPSGGPPPAHESAAPPALPPQRARQAPPIPLSRRPHGSSAAPPLSPRGAQPPHTALSMSAGPGPVSPRRAPPPNTPLSMSAGPSPMSPRGMPALPPPIAHDAQQQSWRADSSHVDANSPIAQWLDVKVPNLTPEMRAQLLPLLEQNMARSAIDIRDWTDLDFRKIGFTDPVALQMLLAALKSV